MKLTSYLNPNGIDYIVAEALKQNGKIPATFKSIMSPALVKTVERRVKYFLKNKDAAEKFLEQFEPKEATAIEETVPEAPEEVVQVEPEPEEVVEPTEII